MAASEICDHQNRSDVMGWLIITYFSNNTTFTHCLTPAMTTHTTTDLTYTKLTPHLFLHNLSHPLTHTHTHTQLCWKHSDGWNIYCKIQLYLFWINQLRNSYGIRISQKAITVEQSKPSPKSCVICYEKAPVTELTKPRDVEWYLWTTIPRAVEF